MTSVAQQMQPRPAQIGPQVLVQLQQAIAEPFQHAWGDDTYSHQVHHDTNKAQEQATWYPI